jgi:uncharacterized protein (DUF2164 family)
LIKFGGKEKHAMTQCIKDYIDREYPEEIEEMDLVFRKINKYLSS